jgi:uncharacterized protein (UPF0335 family)
MASWFETAQRRLLTMREFFSCGRAVDECDVALTQGAALLRVIPRCGARPSAVFSLQPPTEFIQEYPMATSAVVKEEAPATKFAKDQLKAIIERIERLEEEKKTISDDIRDVYAEAKGNGFDVKALRTIVRLRKQDANERAEEETILETYMQALGML